MNLDPGDVIITKVGRYKVYRDGTIYLIDPNRKVNKRIDFEPVEEEEVGSWRDRGPLL